MLFFFSGFSLPDSLWGNPELNPPAPKPSLTCSSRSAQEAYEGCEMAGNISWKRCLVTYTHARMHTREYSARIACYTLSSTGCCCCGI